MTGPLPTSAWRRIACAVLAEALDPDGVHVPLAESHAWLAALANPDDLEPAATTYWAPATRAPRGDMSTPNPIRHITFDAHEPLPLARFWAEVTGYTIDAESDSDEAFIEPPQPGTPGVLFVKVDDDKVAKNRVHLDIEPATGTRDETVERLLGLGAVLHEDHRVPDGRGWVTLRDPEGNEFCVERSAPERAATERSATPG